jgi:hypothetical protein
MISSASAALSLVRRLTAPKRSLRCASSELHQCAVVSKNVSSASAASSLQSDEAKRGIDHSGTP